MTLEKMETAPIDREVMLWFRWSNGKLTARQTYWTESLGGHWAGVAKPDMNSVIGWTETPRR